MKTFEDLIFEPHPIMPGLQAVCHFDNGYCVSVVRFKTGAGGGYGSYTDNEDEWELAVGITDGEGFNLTYDTPVTDDVVGHLDANGVTEIMRQVQELESITTC